MDAIPITSRRCAGIATLTLCALLVLVVAVPARAHPEGFSGLKVDLVPEEVRASLTLHTRDMGNWFPPGAFANYVEDVCRAMERSAPQLLDVRMNDVPVLPV